MAASPSDVGFRANPAERLMQPRTLSPLPGTSRALAFLGALLIHAGILSFLLLEHELEPAIAPVAQEIPVEIVAESPPTKPDDPAPKPEPASTARPVDLEPAYDAPRAANNEKIVREAPDDATKAPGPPTTAKAPSLNPAPAEAAGPTRESELHAAENSAEPDRDKAADEEKRPLDADREAPAQEQARAEPNAQPEKLPTFIGEPFPTWSAGAQFSTSEYLPEIELGSAAGSTSVAGGKAKSTYLSILYGMIMSHVRAPPAAHVRSVGKIVFTVDGTGKLVERAIARSSGSRDLDSAALAAVGEAAPFPPPPLGMSARLTFTYDAR
jgi:TonB family protein